jgi:hypothetical protein
MALSPLQLAKRWEAGCTAVASPGPTGPGGPRSAYHEGKRTAVLRFSFRTLLKLDQVIRSIVRRSAVKGKGSAVRPQPGVGVAPK